MFRDLNRCRYIQFKLLTVNLEHIISIYVIIEMSWHDITIYMNLTITYLSQYCGEVDDISPRFGKKKIKILGKAQLCFYRLQQQWQRNRLASDFIVMYSIPIAPVAQNIMVYVSNNAVFGWSRWKVRQRCATFNIVM